MTLDRTEQLIRNAFAQEADRAVDPGQVLAALRGDTSPSRRHGPALLVAAVVVVVAAVATFVVPEVFRRSTPSAPPAADEPAPVVAQDRDVLVVGLDDSGRTDSVALVRLGKDQSVTMVSLPRDLEVRQPNGDLGRLNQVYTTDGVEALAATVGELTGVTPDGHVVVETAAIGKLSTAVGGVPVCLNAATSDPRSGAEFRAGEQVVEGPAALAFLRQRYGLPNGDLDRITRLQAFLRSLAREMRDADPATVLTAVRDHVTADPDLDLLGLAQQASAATSMRFTTVPVTENVTPGGAATLAVDPAEVRALVENARQEIPAAHDGTPCVN